MAKKSIDWTFIRPLWEEGVNNVEIVRRYCEVYKNSSTHARTIVEGTIRHKATRDKWKKALASLVLKRIKEKLVIGDAQGEPLELTDEVVVDRAAEKGAEVVRLHRRDIEKLRKTEQELLMKLDPDYTELRIGTYQGQFFEKSYKLGLKERSDIARNLAFVIDKRIRLERQAHGLDEKGTGADFDKVEVIDG